MANNKVEVILVPTGDTPNSMPGTHKGFNVLANGKKIGELIHRISKDTYHTNLEDDFNMLDSNKFMGWNFNKTMVEIELSEKLTALFNQLNP